MRKNKSSQPVKQERNTSEREETANRTSLTRTRRNLQSQLSTRSQGKQLRAGLAVVAGRTAGALSRRLHVGGGTSIVGIVAQRMYPGIVEHLATQLEHGSIIVTGTNGKTTTSGFIANIIRDAGLRVWHNKEGSNMMRGIASSLVIRALPSGKLKRSGKAISILEVDEATLPQVTQAITPRVLLFNNLFRDQLDRYGEVDSISSQWQKTLQNLPTSTILVLNADDPTTAQLGRDFAGQVVYYGVDDLSLDLSHKQEDEQHQVIDSRTCPLCGEEYVYDARFYSHIGHYHCPNGDWSRPQPQVRVTKIQPESFDRQRLHIAIGDTEHELVVPLPGIYNIYNTLGAIAVAEAINLPWIPVQTGIERFKPVFGRGESIDVEGRTIRLLLAKNPTGFNEVLRTLFSPTREEEHTALTTEVSITHATHAGETTTDTTVESSQPEKPTEVTSLPAPDKRHVFFVLNDNTADGRDISWIWDVDFERAVGNVASVTISGTRARDLMLRLKYAGIAETQMRLIPSKPLRAEREKHMSRRRHSRAKGQPEGSESYPAGPSTRVYGVQQAIRIALEQTPERETLFVVPTYTGLLEIHRLLEEQGLAPRYWEGRDA
jgi:UDP-N-acetylmuramyl tripeptide synthase